MKYWGAAIQMISTHSSMDASEQDPGGISGDRQRMPWLKFEFFPCVFKWVVIDTGNIDYGYMQYPDWSYFSSHSAQRQVIFPHWCVPATAWVPCIQGSLWRFKWITLNQFVLFLSGSVNINFNILKSFFCRNITLALVDLVSISKSLPRCKMDCLFSLLLFTLGNTCNNTVFLINLKASRSSGLAFLDQMLF